MSEKVDYSVTIGGFKETVWIVFGRKADKNYGTLRFEKSAKQPVVPGAVRLAWPAF